MTASPASIDTLAVVAGTAQRHAASLDDARNASGARARVVASIGAPDVTAADVEMATARRLGGA